jgi:hypothetical protein
VSAGGDGAEAGAGDEGVDGVGDGVDVFVVEFGDGVESVVECGGGGVERCALPRMRPLLHSCSTGLRSTSTIWRTTRAYQTILDFSS